MLTIEDHRRDVAGLRYVYPVVSRRAGGVSLGINLNPNNACNWACIYCQVEGLQRGGPPPLDLALLAEELHDMLARIVSGDFLMTRVPPESRRLVDVAFSGNGEPTSAPEFAEAVDCVADGLNAFSLLGQIPLRLITNGSLLHRPQVQAGIATLGSLAGEVWFKLDRALPEQVLAVNGVRMPEMKMQRNLARCAALAPTWVQTCWFAMDGQAPDDAALSAYCDLLHPLAPVLKGIHLYGLARPSMQAGAARLSRFPAADLQAVATVIQEKTGITVNVSP